MSTQDNFERDNHETAGTEDELQECKHRLAELEKIETQYHHTLEELKESETRYRNLVESSPIPIIIHSQEKIVLINSEAVHILGGNSQNDFIGKEIWTLLPPEYIDASRERIRKIYEKIEHAALSEIQFTRLDGTVIDIEVMGTIVDFQGKPASQVVFRDITAKKQAQKAVEQRIRLEHIISRISLRMMTSDNFDLTEAFHDTMKIVGECMNADRVQLLLFLSESPSAPPSVYEWCAPGIPNHKELVQSLSPNLFPWWMNKLRNQECVLIKTLDELPEEAATDKKTLKSLGICSLVTVPLIDHEKFIGFLDMDSIHIERTWDESDVAILQTMSYILVSTMARKSAHNSLEIQKTYLEELFNNSPDAIAILDRNDCVLRINKKFVEMFQYSHDEVVGKLINELIVPPGFEKEASILTEKVTNLEDIDVESVRQSKTGKKFDVSIRGKQIFLGTDKLAVYAIYRDISSRKRNEEEKRRLEDQLRQAQKMEAIGSLAGGIAHDFNNILSVIFGYTELTFEKLPPGSRARVNLRYVLSAADKAKEMVKQILAFSRKDERKRAPVSLAAIVTETLTLLKSTLPSYIEIRSNIGKTQYSIMADATQIHQVIMNICTNAAHAMKDKGGTLEITLREENVDPAETGKSTLSQGIYQILSFSDTGTGIRPEILNRIFEPYFTTKSQSEGTGMGLAVVHGIIKNHGGDITVHSELGEGTTFYIFLPVTGETLITSTTKPEGFQEGKGRIMLVDDDPGLVEMGKLMLESLGYFVVAHTGSIDALDAFKSEPQLYDLIITDQTMPRMTGDQLAGEIRKIRPRIPILLCTGFSDRINEDNFEAMGIDGFMLKPIVRKELSKVVHDLLEKSKSEI